MDPDDSEVTAVTALLLQQFPEAPRHRVESVVRRCASVLDRLEPPDFLTAVMADEARRQLRTLQRLGHLEVGRAGVGRSALGMTGLRRNTTPE